MLRPVKASGFAVSAAGVVCTAPVTPSGPFMLTGSVEPLVRAPTDAPSETGLDSVAPAAGFAVRISGTTQATAPAAATADMRPMASRRERRGGPARPSAA